MTKLKKLLEKPIKQEDVERIKWLYSGINVLNEISRKAALEKDSDFMEKLGNTLTPEEFHTYVFSKKINPKMIPEKYRREMDRYHDMFSSSVAEMLKMENLKGAEIGKMLGLPNASENLFELKKKGKTIGFAHFNNKKKTIDFIAEIDDLPKKFREKIKE